MSLRILSIVLWLLSSLVVVAIVYVAVDSGPESIPLVGSMWERSGPLAQLPPILIVGLFSWVLIEIVLKQQNVRRQHSAVQMFRAELAKGEAAPPGYKPDAFNLKDLRGIRRANLIIECSSPDNSTVSSLHEAVPAASIVDSRTLAASYVALNVYAWILPVLGFVGTASGMASAISGFKDALGSGLQPDQIASVLSQTVIPELAGAFGTTILALGAALVTYLCTATLRNWDEEALIELDRLCIVLLSRIPPPEGPEGKKVIAFLGEIHGTLLRASAMREEVANLIRAAAQTFTEASREALAAGAGLSKATESLSSASKEAAAAAGSTSTAARSLFEASQELLDAATLPFIVTVQRGQPQ